MSRIEEFETLRRAATQELQRLQGQFESVGLTWSLLEIDPDAQGDNEEPHTVELRIWFYRDDEPVDFLEYFLFRDGAVVASEEDVRAWIREDAKDVIAKQRRG
ncbi:MAG: hypothetical protein D6746_11595 [Bacteroidetes bacterium]|nr:MAG: hypothetical protein D6746_11595 [Bacteroidota bacterium]